MSFDVDAWLRAGAKNSQKFHVSQPYQAGCWSKKSERRGGELQQGSREGLHGYHTPAMPADLNAGFPTSYTPKDESLPATVEPVAEAVSRANMLDQCDVCTFRNNLNKIFMTPLDLSSTWTVDACNLGSTLYLDIYKTPQATFPNADLFQYYGYKFEALCTQQDDVDATSEYAALIRLRLDKLRILLAAEIDCFDPSIKSKDNADVASYIELKTFTVPENAHKADNIKRFKYPKDVLTWMQQTAKAQPGCHLRFSYKAVGGRRAIQYNVLEDGQLPSRLQQCLAAAH